MNQAIKQKFDSPTDGYGLAGRVAIVTGSGQNIGKAIAVGFARAGAIPIIADVNMDCAMDVAREIEREGFQALAVETDISSVESVESMIDTVARRYERVDILINNAAKFTELKYRDFSDIPLDEWEQVLRVNITGTFLCVRTAVKHMRKAGWGRIVNMSSGTVRVGRPRFLHYVSSKSSLVGMGRSLARELGPYGITVNTLFPGVIFTDQQRQRLPEDYQKSILSSQCIPGPLSAEALVGPVLFLSSDQSRYVTGQEFAVDGGLTHG